jgi:citrate lyase subunit beta-like protein
MLDKSRTLSVDCVAYDLEDSVTSTRKAEARALVRRAIDQPIPSGIRERAVRINSVRSGLAFADLSEMVGTYPFFWPLSSAISVRFARNDLII